MNLEKLEWGIETHSNFKISSFTEELAKRSGNFIAKNHAIRSTIDPGSVPRFGFFLTWTIFHTLAGAFEPWIRSSNNYNASLLVYDEESRQWFEIRAISIFFQNFSSSYENTFEQYLKYCRYYYDNVLAELTLKNALGLGLKNYRLFDSNILRLVASYVFFREKKV